MREELFFESACISIASNFDGLAPREVRECLCICIQAKWQYIHTYIITNIICIASSPALYVSRTIELFRCAALKKKRMHSEPLSSLSVVKVYCRSRSVLLCLCLLAVAAAADVVVVVPLYPSSTSFPEVRCCMLSLLPPRAFSLSPTRCATPLFSLSLSIIDT